MSGERSRAVQVTEVTLIALASLAFLALLVVSGLAASPNADKYGFKNSTGDISDHYYTQVTPAGFTFSIWGVIYTWQVLWLLYAWTFPCRPTAPRTIAVGVYPGFAIGCVITASWLYIWGNYLATVAFAFLVLFNLVIYVTISTLSFFYFSRMSIATKFDVNATRILVLNGLSLFATWSTIAMLINLCVVLQYSLSVSASTSASIALSLLSAALIAYFSLENTILDQYSRYVFTVYPVVIWALIGILAKHWGKSGETRNTVFSFVLLLATVALAFTRSILFVIFFHFRPLKKKSVKEAPEESELPTSSLTANLVENSVQM